MRVSVLVLLTLASMITSTVTFASEDTDALTQDEMRQLAEELHPTVETLRGLEFKSTVPVEIVSKKDAQRHFRARYDKFYPESRLEAEQTVHIQLGLLPPDTDLSALIFDLLDEQVAAYYDPERDTFFMLEGTPRLSTSVFAVHELTHALDDQYYSIDAIIETALDNSDRATAAGAVVEGSGSLVMSAYLITEMTAQRIGMDVIGEMQSHEAGRAEKFLAAPPILQRSLLGSYILGQTFLTRGDPMAIMAGVNPEDLTRVFEDLPASTEQILHPEKYWDRDQVDLPRNVELTDLSPVIGKGWSLIADDVLGELSLAVLIDNTPIDVASPMKLLQSSTWTNDAASGWGGDRWQLYGNGRDRITILATTWDSDVDAQEFEAALVSSEALSAWRRHDAVVVVAGDATEAQEKALAETVLLAITSETQAVER